MRVGGEDQERAIKDMYFASKKERSEKLESLPNIGKVIGDKLRKIDIKSAEEFLKRDPYVVFDELRKKVDPTLCRCALASIIGAKADVPWHTITKETAKEYEKKHPGHKWGRC